MMEDDKHVRDKTVGESKIDPLNYKNDVLVQLWIDGRVLATLSMWLDAQGIYTRHLSEVSRLPLKLMVDMLVKQGDIDMVEDTANARYYLNRKYGVVLNPSGRGGKNILHNVALSDRRGELGEVVRHHHEKSLDDANRPTHPDPQIAARVKKAQEMYDKKFITVGVEPNVSDDEGGEK